jgi:hypothetical protein
MDWNNEVKDLRDGEVSDYFKPSEGQHKIKILDDGVAHQFEWEGEVINKVNFKVEVNGKESVWSVPRGKTLSSLYGQLAQIGMDKGTLKGQTITLLVKGQNKQRQYIVMESLELTKNKVKQEKVK